MSTQLPINFRTRPLSEEMQKADRDHIRRLNASKERLIAAGDFGGYKRILKAIERARKV